MVRLLLVLMAALWLSVVAASWSEAAEDSENEYNFSWLDPDKKVSVLQNRKFRKANRVLLSLNYGFAKNNAYRTSMALDPRLAYYFSEAWGIEVFYSVFQNKENNTGKTLVGTGVRPSVIEPKNQMGVMLNWIPWYAKINVFNTILQFDWSFAAGVGTMNANMIPGSTETGFGASTKSLSAFYLGTGHQFHVSENFVIRLDFRNAFFKAPKRAVTGEEIYFNGTTFQIGAGFRL